jgi:hypothetical protein
MTTYPGENPQPPDDDPAETSDAGTPAADSPLDAPEAQPDPGTEPTQPVGYWERQAAEQARERGQQDPYAPPGGAVFNPTSGQAPPGWDQQGGTRPYEQNPYGQQQPYGQPSYGQPAYGQPAYGQPAYGQPPPAGQSGVQPGGPPGYPPYAAFSAPRPDHPQSTTSLILGIIGLVGGFVCGLGLILSPFAWALGRNALKEIRASQGQLGGEGTAKAGMITGIVGTVLLGLGVLLLIGFAVLVAVDGTSSGSNV